MTTDTSERGLERLICAALTGSPCESDVGSADSSHERPAIYGAGWICGETRDYDRDYCVDLAQLSAFIQETQPEAAEALDLGQDGPTRQSSWHAWRESCPEAAGPGRGGLVERHSRSDRHGQLPGRETGGDADPASGRRRGDRTGADNRGGHKPEPELDRLSNILKAFNDSSATSSGPTPIERTGSLPRIFPRTV